MSKQRQTSVERLVLQSLESLQAAGVEQLAKPSAAALDALRQATTAGERTTTELADVGPAAVELPNAEPASAAAAEPSPVEPSPVEPPVSTAATLEILQAEVADCTQCDELAATRTQTVFGVGDPHARLCILGEAPGADEDQRGEPFVGRGGQLLNKILAACGLQREEVYIMNVLRCRPPGNRNPTETEAANCRRFLERQLQLVSPEFVCCMGAVAAQNLLSTTTPIGRLRGTLHDYRGIKVVCTYHPAYLLRNPSAKKNTWEDMKMLMAAMGKPVG